MREIKFRAWDTIRGEMYIDVHKLYDFMPTKADGKYGDRFYESFGDLLMDETVVVEQYTGLRDVNGVEVYEGDILDCHANGECPVVFDAGGFVCKQGSSNVLLALCIKMQMGDVVGNIHEGVKEDAVQ